MTTHTHVTAGVVVAVVSAVLYNTGFVIEKSALGRLPAIHARRLSHLITSLLSSPLWVAGFCTMLGGLALQVLALSLVSISVVQPILVSGIVVLLVLSHVFLKERLGRRELVAVCLVAGSLLAVSLSLDSSSDRAGTHGAFGALVLAAVPTGVVAGWLFLRAERVVSSSGRHSHLAGPLFGIATGLVYGIAALATKAVATLVQQYGVVAALPHVLRSAYLYALIVSSAIGLFLFQTALQRCRASVVVPVSNTVTSIYAIAVGTVIFGEHLPSSGWKLALRLAGVVGVLTGVLLLATAMGPEDGQDLALLEEPVTLPVPATEPAPQRLPSHRFVRPARGEIGET